MPRRVDPLGKLLLRAGVLTQDTLSDTLEQQRTPLPLASLCYVLGHADEESLVRALCSQHGVPGVVLDRCVIHLDALAGVPRNLALRHRILPILEDERRIYVAAEKPLHAGEVLRELEFVSGKSIVVHVALAVTLARTLRACYQRRGQGEQYWIGPEATFDENSGFGAMVLVSATDGLPRDEPLARAHEVLMDDITKELVDLDLVSIDPGETLIRDFATQEDDTPFIDSDTTNSDGSGRNRMDTDTPLSQIELVPIERSEEPIDLDEGGHGDTPVTGLGPPRILVVDDDFATRHLLVKVLQPAGYVTLTASSGRDAIRQIQSTPPNLVIVDVMLPQVNGFQICRAIKQSERFNHIPVILMSAVIDSGRVTDAVLRRYGANAYFEKPLDTDRFCRRVQDLLSGEGTAERVSVDDGTFEAALELYRSGHIDNAVDVLRGGLDADPLSAKHHFVLANLLQKKSLIYEAIDEYEATVDLKPDYFPALTRLAYLYYKKGFSAKAIDTWRRSLPHCPDTDLRQNIEVFMRKLIADIQSEA